MDFISIWADLEPSQQDEVLERLLEESLELFEAYTTALTRATGMREMTGQEKLESFRARSPDIWARLQAMFPRDYKQMMRDWGKLEGRDIKRAASVTPPRNPMDSPVAYR